MYALTTHTSALSVKPRLPWIEGSATFTIVVSSTIMSSPAHSMYRASHFFRSSTNSALPRSFLEVDRDLEAAEEHALPVERELLRVHHACDARILHRVLVDTVAVRAVLVHRPGEPHHFALPELHRLRERRDLARLHVVAHGLGVGQRAVLAPDAAHLARDLLVLLHVLPRNGNDESIDIRHANLLVLGRLNFELVRIEREPLPDCAHLVVGRLVAPDRVFRPAGHREVGRVALERAMRLVGAAHEPVHLHVLAGNVIDHRRERLFPLPHGLVQLDGLARVGDDLAAEHDLHVRARRIGADAVTGILLEAGSGIRHDPPSFCIDFAIWRIALCTSSMLTSRTCVATDQWWPNGSSSLP